MAKTRYFNLTLSLPANENNYWQDIGQFNAIIRNTIGGAKIKSQKFCVQHFSMNTLPGSATTIQIRCNLASSENGYYYGTTRDNFLYNNIILIENLKAGYNFDGPSNDEWFHCDVLTQNNVYFEYFGIDDQPLTLNSTSGAMITLRFKFELDD